MRILVFGETGQLARELTRRAGTHTLETHGRSTADFMDPNTCLDVLAASGAEAVINATAYTAVDAAEDDEASATQINGTTPGLLAEACAARGIPFVHVSTDYVFDGGGTAPFQPGDPTGPLGAYGRSKLTGETAIRAAGGSFAILRSSWVVSAHGKNFVKTMLRLGAERDSLNVVADQIGGPTPAAALADACLVAAQSLAADASKAGVYHVSGGPDVSWADFAREIFRMSGISCEVAGIPSSDYPTPAQRPLNSRLDNSAFEQAFGLARPDWRSGLHDILEDLGVFK